MGAPGFSQAINRVYAFDIPPAATPNYRPVADAGPDQSVDEQTLLQLDGTGSFDPDLDPLAYSWAQLQGIIPRSFPSARGAGSGGPGGSPESEAGSSRAGCHRRAPRRRQELSQIPHPGRGSVAGEGDDASVPGEGQSAVACASARVLAHEGQHVAARPCIEDADGAVLGRDEDALAPASKPTAWAELTPGRSPPDPSKRLHTPTPLWPAVATRSPRGSEATSSSWPETSTRRVRSSPLSGSHRHRVPSKPTEARDLPSGENVT
jgi:hypothetical protein